jgi:DMSO/TMAO reductase YedYZ molybdopterin-dependent catalytic subunit
MVNRRRFLQRATLGVLGGFLAGCNRLSNSDTFVDILSSAEGLTRRVQQFLSPSTTLAREFTVADISPVFKPNGTTMPGGPVYKALLDNQFRDYRLKVDGMVANPTSLSLAELRALGERTQITRHDCVEGWSAIGQWQGTPLVALLALVRPLAGARFVVFHCFDVWDDDVYYYESIDLVEAVHPQTILAHSLNGETLPVANGAPLRLRVERQLGYKQAKYIERIELVASLDDIGEGKGGYWEDDQGYEWYGGI